MVSANGGNKLQETDDAHHQILFLEIRTDVFQIMEEPILTPEQEQDIAWTKEEINFFPGPDWIYRVACFTLGKKKLTYQQMFLVIYGMNKHLGEKKAKEYALQKIIWIYELNNNGKLPEGIKRNGA